MTSADAVTDVLTLMRWGALTNKPPAPAAPIRSLVESLWLGRRPWYRLDNPNQVAQSTHSSQKLDGATTVSSGVADDGNTVARQTAGPAPDGRASTPTHGAEDVGPAPVLADLVARPDVAVSLNADGTVGVIQGAFTDTPVTTIADATRVLNGLAPLLGAATGFATPDNITVQKIDSPSTEPNSFRETFYRVRNSVDGVPVLASEVILATDGSGRVTGLFNSHDGRIDGINVTPDARIYDQADAIVAATKYLNSTAPPLYRWLGWKFKVSPGFEPDLVINALDPGAAPRLAWRIIVDPAGMPQLLGLPTRQPAVTYFVYANGADAGTVIRQGATAQALADVSSTTVANDVLGRSRDINVSQLQLLIFSVDTLDDQTRHIATYQSIGLNALGLVGIPVIEGPWGWNPSAVSAHANMGVVYDYYKNVLGLNSFDGNGAPIAVAVDYNPLGPVLGYFSKYDNAYWDANTKELVFGDGGDLEGALDIVGHEYTHAVVSYVVGQGTTVWESGESGALNEAYADILGSLIEGKTGPDRWLMGEDSTFGGGALRSLADPTSFDTPYGPYRDNYASRYTGTEDQGGVHGNSTIFSHAAYLMMTDPATSGITDDTWATVFYHSLYRLGPDATFSDGRAAVLDSAIAYGFTAEQQAAVERAFDDVGIVAPATVMV